MWEINIITVFYLVLPLVSTYDWGGLMSGNSMGAVPLGGSLGGDGELDVEGVCWGPGVACQNCTRPVMCIALPMGWLKVPLPSCEGEETCNARLGGCSKSPVPECTEQSRTFEHICEQVGIFPDAYDCRKFHTCMPASENVYVQNQLECSSEHRSALCPRHHGYNPQNAQCSIKLNHGQCEESPVPECSSLAQMGPLPSTSNYYYLCLRKKDQLRPQIFVCPNGWFWNGYCKPEPPQEKKVTGEDKKTNDDTKREEIDKVKKRTTERPTEEETNLIKKDDDKKGQDENSVHFRSIFDMYPPEKPMEYPKDTFLADRYDFSHLDNAEGSDGIVTYGSYESVSSFEQ